MTWRAAIWTVALVISLSLHAMLALAVSGLRGAAPGVALAELRIADDAGFAVTVVRPVEQPIAPEAQPPKAGIQSADAINPVAPMALAPAPTTADHDRYGTRAQHDEIAVAAVPAEHLKAARPEKPLSPVANGGASLADSGPATAKALEPVSPQSVAVASSAEQPAAAEEVLAPAEHLKATGPDKSLSPVASAGSMLSAAPGESVADAVPATTTALEPVSPQSAAAASSAGTVVPTVAEQQAVTVEVLAAAAPVAKPVRPVPLALSGISPPGTVAAVPTVPSAALPGVPAQKLAPVPQQVALAPAALAPASLAERMRNFVRFYDGGTCFFAVPVPFAGQRPRIDGFGSDAEPILTFGAELRRTLGIDAEIVVRQITGEQCPAIGFIGGLLKSRLPELAVRLEADYIASGDELRGRIEGAALPWLSLLLVDDDGMVHDISKYLQHSDAGPHFAVPVYLTAQGKDRNQLIVAIAARRALDRLKLTGPAAGSELFPAVVREADATQNDIAIGIGAFRVE
jgi:eukaryotic-like serine/threonine-protein kinase